MSDVGLGVGSPRSLGRGVGAAVFAGFGVRAAAPSSPSSPGSAVCSPPSPGSVSCGPGEFSGPLDSSRRRRRAWLGRWCWCEAVDDLLGRGREVPIDKLISRADRCRARDDADAEQQRGDEGHRQQREPEAGAPDQPLGGCLLLRSADQLLAASAKRATAEAHNPRHEPCAAPARDREPRACGGCSGRTGRPRSSRRRAPRPTPNRGSAGG